VPKERGRKNCSRAQHFKGAAAQDKEKGFKKGGNEEKHRGEMERELVCPAG